MGPLTPNVRGSRYSSSCPKRFQPRPLMNRTTEPSADRLTTTQRSQLMGRVRQRDTGVETALGKAMWAKGHRCRRNRRIHEARSESSFSKAKLPVFAHGCFLHGCPLNYSAPVGISETASARSRVPGSHPNCHSILMGFRRSNRRLGIDAEIEIFNEEGLATGEDFFCN